MEETVQTLTRRRGWTAWLFEGEEPVTRDDAVRVTTGLLLGAAYGAAIGSRGGAASMMVHAAGAPAALAAVGAVGVPSLYIVLGLAGVPVTPRVVLACAARAAATTGVVLGGLAPAALLFAVTTESTTAAAVAAGAGLAVASLLALRRFRIEIEQRLADAKENDQKSATVILVVFAAVAIALATRIWWTTLPMLAGGQ